MVLEKANYPRTGKRGVPQTFPRKLHEMLEAESNGTIVHWTSSGLAFRIADVSLFSTEVLPKYFKTSKFSSFQRNLNLYGFAKIRKGPETDSYYHPGFVRGDEAGLSQLRKRTKAPNKKAQALYYPKQVIHGATATFPFEHYQNTSARVVSPTSSPVGKHHDSFKSGRKENPERLMILADTMLMMLGGE